MAKRKCFLPVIYISALAFLPPILGWTMVPQHNAPLFEYIKRFTNLVPFRGIAEAVGMVFNSGRIAYLTRYAINLFVLLPVGLMCGMNKRKLKNATVWYAVVLVLVYGMRVMMKLGSFDIDDILLNLLGLSIGWVLGNMITRVTRTG